MFPSFLFPLTLIFLLFSFSVFELLLRYIPVSKKIIGTVPYSPFHKSWVFFGFFQWISLSCSRMQKIACVRYVKRFWLGGCWCKHFRLCFNAVSCWVCTDLCFHWLVLPLQKVLYRLKCRSAASSDQLPFRSWEVNCVLGAVKTSWNNGEGVSAWWMYGRLAAAHVPQQRLVQELLLLLPAGGRHCPALGQSLPAPEGRVMKFRSLPGSPHGWQQRSSRCCLLQHSSVSLPQAGKVGRGIFIFFAGRQAALCKPTGTKCLPWSYRGKRGGHIWWSNVYRDFSDGKVLA